MKPTKTVTSIGVVAFVIAAAITGLAGISGTAWSGYDHMIVLFCAVFFGVIVLGHDPGPRRAQRRRRRPLAASGPDSNAGVQPSPSPATKRRITRARRGPAWAPASSTSSWVSGWPV